ncbi:MAG TPA: hypothetical protein PLT48_13370 [Nitrospira sp.]|nr:hypothetical protein [Nitrospira sp.]HNC90844.1 hypothetical protein [Anaerolineales bacterium]
MMETVRPTVQKPTEQVRNEAERVRRPERIPFGVPQSRLNVPLQIPGYHLHFINDSPGRLQQAQLGGYTFVAPSEIGLSGAETQYKVLAGRNEDGSAMYAYLMKIELEFYEEDQRFHQKTVDQFDEAIRRGKIEERGNENRYGKMNSQTF